MRGSEGCSLRHIAGNRGLLLAPSPLYNLKAICNAKRCREIVLQPGTLAAMQGPAPDRIHAFPDTLRTRGDPSTPPAPAGTFRPARSPSPDRKTLRNLPTSPASRRNPSPPLALGAPLPHLRSTPLPPKTSISTRRRAMHNNSPEAMPELHAAAPDVAARDKLEGGRAFVMHTEFSPAGDQPTAIVELSEGVRGGERSQVLLGATGTGKTFTMARVIEETQRPAIILAPNKTLAAQLYGEFKGFFPENAVEYFVSYYDYYQPEAYVPRSDTYIEK